MVVAKRAGPAQGEKLARMVVIGRKVWYNSYNTMEGNKMTTIEYLSGDQSWVSCKCGNIPTSDGFFTCDETGRIVEPTLEKWTTDWYVCVRCGIYFDNETLEVKGIADADAVNHNDNYDWTKY